MVQIIVALIAMLGTIAAAVLPKLLEKRSSANSPAASEPASLALVFILAIFVLVGAWSSFDRANEISPLARIQFSFFLGVAGVASALFGRCAVSHRQSFGTYVGYVSAITAALFLLWSILVNNTPESSYVLAYAWANTIAVGWSLWLFWRWHVLLQVAEDRKRRAENERSGS